MSNKTVRIPRDDYINWLLSYKDKNLIKILSGLRRVGKSVLFELFIDRLKSMGVEDSQIINLNFESLEYAELRTKETLYPYLTSRLAVGKTTYIFLDEIQRVEGFEEVVDSLFVKDGVDLYLTCSNAVFLSSEIATLLTGRYVEINVLPLSFKEYFLHFNDSGRSRNELFRDYITFGGMPGEFMFKNGSRQQREYVESVFRTILEKDVLRRNNDISKRVVEQLIRFVIYNIGSITSVKKIVDTLNSNGVKVSYNTVDRYFQTLQDCFFVYKADRYDLVGKEYLAQLNKYYISDFGFKRYILNNKEVEIQQILENLVYLELRRRGYRVATGKVADKEVDFVVIDSDGMRQYIQVAVSVSDPFKLEQELRPFRAIDDNYSKTILTLDEFFVPNHDGIRTMNAIDFLLDSVVIG